jgi:drug/metabolite transporter (DMT)-like permease
LTTTAETRGVVARSSADRWRLLGAFFAVYVLYGTNYLAMRIMVRNDMPALLGSGVRYLAAGVVTLALVGLVRPVSIAGASRGHLFLSGLLLLGTFGVITKAIETIDSGLAAIIVAAVPVIVVLVRVGVDRERVPTAVLVSAGVGFAGVAFILVGSSGVGSGAPFALALVAVATVGQALGQWSMPRLRLPSNLFVSAGCQMAAGGVALLVAGVFAGELDGLDLARIEWDAYAAFAYLVVVGTMVTFSALVWLLQRVSVSQVASATYVNPIVAVILGWAFAGESLPTAALIGSPIVLAAVAATVLRDRVPDAS